MTVLDSGFNKIGYTVSLPVGSRYTLLTSSLCLPSFQLAFCHRGPWSYFFFSFSSFRFPREDRLTRLHEHIKILHSREKVESLVYWSQPENSLLSVITLIVWPP